MTTNLALKDTRWITAGAVVLLLLVLVVMHFYRDNSPVAMLADKARRVDLVNQMRLSLASASEAEKSAVLVTTDEESQTYADRARAATADVVREQQELNGLLPTDGAKAERDSLGQFTKDFAEYQVIDKDLLALAVKNTNLKAYSLAFGPSADALKAMDASLDRLLQQSANTPESGTVTLLALGAEIAAQRIQSLLAPHIAEESDQKMDTMEATMTSENQTVHKDLDGLSALKSLNGNPDLASALSSYADFSGIRTKILALSRENTNVRSMSISLNQKAKIAVICQVDLATLQQAIFAEPIPGVTYGLPVIPR